MKYKYGKQREAKKNVFTFDRFAKFVGGAACIFEAASIACRSDFCLEAKKRLKRNEHVDDCIDGDLFVLWFLASLCSSHSVVWSVSCAIDTLPHTPQTQYTQQVSPWGSREEFQLAEIIRSQALVIKYPTSHEQYRFTKNRTIHSPHDSLSGPTHTWPALDHHLLCQRFDHFILCHPRLKITRTP
jgi:hypothetical protein